MRILAALTLCLLTSACLADRQPGGVIVTTTAGQVESVASDGILAFKGIPFARPPVGELRWRAPQAAQPWQGVKHANVAGPACPQHNPREGGYGPDPVQSEDCLTLNIWKPADSVEKLPVMVWIYGGSFERGDGTNPLFDGARLARNGVMVVTFNYRLGRLGWFAHPSLTQEAQATANFGLMDQIAALEWVQKNIVSFGGDPANVTIFGESAGAMSVNLLMTSPEAQGLFAKAITQSGLGRMDARPLKAAEEQGVAFASSAGAGDLAALRALPVESVLAGQSAGASGNNPGPIIDGVLVPGNVDRAFADGKQARVPWIIGSNDYEADLFPAFLDDPDGSVFALIPETARPAMMTLFDPDKTGDKKAIAAHLSTDYAFTEPARFLAAAQTKTRQPVYRYFFTYVPEDYRSAIPGAGHAAEIQFVFGTLGTFPWGPTTFTQADRQVADMMGQYWTNFAKTGDPNGSGLALWPEDRGDQVLVVDLAGAHAEMELRKSRLDFLTMGAAVK